ncbi:MAG: hypothetical protein EP345_17360 [Sphingomonadales bacterium]|nr:MAG: hypothetical protein EP345_17360 [Sphingomonadales bacterium]
MNTRATLVYSDRSLLSRYRPIASAVPDELNPAMTLIEGLYRIRRGVWRPIAIWHGRPLDPVTHEPLDRSLRWNVLYCGRPIFDFTSVWPKCSADPIDQAEYDYLIARHEWAKAHDKRDPFASLSGRIDWLNCTPPTF